MKKLITLMLAIGAVGSALAQPSVGVSVGINEPGVYGRVNIGEIPRPALVMPEPVIIAAPRVAFARAPIYLYVPPEHRLHWARYCGRYAACDQPVYFVQENWVRERYAHEHPDWERRHHREFERR
jgi:hypothetical protein